MFEKTMIFRWGAYQLKIVVTHENYSHDSGNRVLPGSVALYFFFIKLGNGVIHWLQ